MNIFSKYSLRSSSISSTSMHKLSFWFRALGPYLSSVILLCVMQTSKTFGFYLILLAILFNSLSALLFSISILLLPFQYFSRRSVVLGLCSYINFNLSFTLCVPWHPGWSSSAVNYFSLWKCVCAEYLHSSFRILPIVLRQIYRQVQVSSLIK